MAFHELAIFPTTVSRRTRSNVGHRHSVLELDSGALSVINRWPKPRRTYDARYGIRKFDDVRLVYEFYLARGGMENGFRFLDPFESTTHTDGRSTWSGSDEVLGQGDGVNVIFQLIKTYTSAGFTHTRTIEKPVIAAVELDGAPQTGSGTHYTLDASTGQIQFVTPPAGGPTPEQVTAGCLFHVPVQFGAEVDELLSISIDAFEGGSIPSIPMVEMVGNVTTPELPWSGGSSAQIVIGNLIYDYAMGHTVQFQVNTPNLFVTLPDITDLTPGGPYFMFKNKGPASLDFRNRKGGVLEWTLASGFGAVVGVVDVNGINKWVAIGGVGL